MYTGKYVEEIEGKDELIGQYFEKIEKYFLRALQSFKDSQGFGVGKVCCGFASEAEIGDEDYFGESGVAFYFEYPYLERNTLVIVDYQTFYNKLKEQSVKYVLHNPDSEKTVEKYLESYKKKFKVKD